MSDKKFKTKDMVIAILCTLLAILCIVFYFLPAFDVKHKADPSADFEVVAFSGWDMTKAIFTETIILGTPMEKLLAIKDAYGFAIILSGILLPLSIICNIATAVFTYLSWLKSEDYKKYCFHKHAENQRPNTDKCSFLQNGFIYLYYNHLFIGFCILIYII